MKKSSLEQCLAETHSCVAYNLRRSSRIISKIYEKEMRGAPIRGPQFSLMIVIAKRGTETITGLARLIGADRTTLTRNLKQLERKGVVQISAGNNHRTKAVRLLPAGEKAVRASIQHWKKAQTKVVNALGKDRWTRMLADLGAVATLNGHAESTLD
ncbi:MAG TPA: MarR family winged helix-turn-helix transcriptional regulator [Bryobacteraceae bacterium]|jgi:DNA-binding MarR family transcriptional regulator|nr:MarR family winged helix-turn-helix transcriptional regulator [Bryobacteraceae bacterium]